VLMMMCGCLFDEIKIYSILYSTKTE